MTKGRYDRVVGRTGATRRLGIACYAKNELNPRKK